MFLASIIKAIMILLFVAIFKGLSLSPPPPAPPSPPLRLTLSSSPPQQYSTSLSLPTNSLASATTFIPTTSPELFDKRKQYLSNHHWSPLLAGAVTIRRCRHIATHVCEEV